MTLRPSLRAYNFVFYLDDCDRVSLYAVANGTVTRARVPPTHAAIGRPPSFVRCLGGWLPVVASLYDGGAP